MSDLKEKRLHSIVVIAVFALIVGGLSVLNLFTEPPPILVSERRVPERMPAFSARTVISGDFMDGFEGYAADSFPFRDGFRTLRAATVFGPFLQTDKDGVFFDSAGIASFRPIDAGSFGQAADKIRIVAEGLDGVNVFYSFIPDKSIYSGRATPGFDPALAEQSMRAVLDPDRFTFIPLTQALGADSFYRTDLHWDQTGIGGVLDALSAAMGIEIDLSQFSKEYAGEFYGAYAGQLALPVRSDSLYFLNNPDIAAFYLNSGTREMEPGPVYDLDRFRGIDPYDIFLRGAQPLIILENNNAASDRELYLFRDSFSSSLAPILASAYSRVVLIDFRFIDLRTVHQLVDFKPGSDALFLYSSGILNKPDVLQVR